MNTEQIIKALECCRRENCIGCPYRWKCHQGNPMHGDALALIKEQQAQIENLKKENKYLRERLKEEAELKEDMKGK